MERQNQKLRAGKKKEETARVRKLVDNAMKNDPRVQAQIQAQQEEKKKRKAEKAARAQARADAEEAAKTAHIRAAEEAAAKEKAAKDADKKRASNLKKARTKFRKACKSGKAGEFEEEDMELVAEGNDLEGMLVKMSNRRFCVGPIVFFNLSAPDDYLLASLRTSLLLSTTTPPSSRMVTRNRSLSASG